VLVSALLLVVLVSTVALIYVKRLSAMLALPLMALLFAVAAAVPRDFILQDLLQQGPLRLGTALMVTIFGGILAALLKNQGMAESLVRYAAELSGDRPLPLALVLMFITAVLFVALGGLGATIMVGSIILPIMMSLGMPPASAATILLIGQAIGGMLNLCTWQLYMSLLNLPQATVRDFMLKVAGLLVIAGLIFCLVSLRRSQLHRFLAAASSRGRKPFRRMSLLAPVVPLLLVLILNWPIATALAAGILLVALASTTEGETAAISLLALLANLILASRFVPEFYGWPIIDSARFTLSKKIEFVALAPFWLWLMYQLIAEYRGRGRRSAYAAILAAALPIVLMHFLALDIVAAFVAGLLVSISITARRKSLQILTRSVIEGCESMAPLIMIIIGAGMMLVTVNHGYISAALRTWLAVAVPTGNVAYVLVFGLLTPLALYRGSLNIWGMGAGFAAILLAGSALKAEAIMAMLVAAGVVQTMCDPANAGNVWIASFTGVETLTITRRAVVYAWPISIAALIIAASIYL